MSERSQSQNRSSVEYDMTYICFLFLNIHVHVIEGVFEDLCVIVQTCRRGGQQIDIHATALAEVRDKRLHGCNGTSCSVQIVI